MTSIPLTMHGLREASPGPRWQALFAATWPGYRRFFRSPRRWAAPSLVSCASALATYMPELLPTWAQLCRETGFDDEASAFLTAWDLPAFAPAGCSQTATGGPTAGLVRNYDYAPSLFEAVSISTDYLSPVIGTGDCLWGLLDGMNADRLVVSLTFGGDRSVGVGFAIPLVVRCLLETCENTGQAVARLRRLPVAMSYNLTMVDAAGESATVHVGPGRDAEVRARPSATNHRWDAPVDPAHASRYASVERLDILDGLRAQGASTEEVVTAMLRPPLHSRDYAGAFGTVYTAAYDIAAREVTYHWPGLAWTRRFDSPDATVDVDLARTPS